MLHAFDQAQHARSHESRMRFMHDFVRHTSLALSIILDFVFLLGSWLLSLILYLPYTTLVEEKRLSCLFLYTLLWDPLLVNFLYTSNWSTCMHLLLWLIWWGACGWAFVGQNGKPTWPSQINTTNISLKNLRRNDAQMLRGNIFVCKPFFSSLLHLHLFVAWFYELFNVLELVGLLRISVLFSLKSPMTQKKYSFKNFTIFGVALVNSLQCSVFFRETFF